jgi:hypothetical protein
VKNFYVYQKGRKIKEKGKEGKGKKKKRTEKEKEKRGNLWRPKDFLVSLLLLLYFSPRKISMCIKREGK